MIKKILSVVACLAAAHGAAAVTPADLQWDLTYRSVLAAHPIGEHELLNHWKYAARERLIHRRMADYNGEPILASLLTEEPSMYFTTEATGRWYVKTRSGVVKCSLNPKRRTEPCKPVDAAKFDAMLAAIRQFQPLAPKDIGLPNTLNDGEGMLDDFGYVGFVSIYDDGQARQWPMAMKENHQYRWMVAQGADGISGRMDDAIGMLEWPDEDLAKLPARVAAIAARDALRAAIRSGDIGRFDTLLRQQPEPGKEVLAQFPAIADAVGSGQRAMIEALLARGAEIDAFGGQALRAAVAASNGDMVEYLRRKGADVNALGPGVPWMGGSTTPLGLTVMRRDTKLAQQLIRDGAKADAPELLLLALRNLDYPMTDLLLRSGADPNGVGKLYEFPPVGFLVFYSARVPGRGADLERLMRRLVEAGAVLNKPAQGCMTMYNLAQYAKSTAMQELLRKLGADPEAGKRCVAEQPKAKG